MDKTKIEWTDATWNPITGCSRVSAGCEHCYAERLAGTRLKHHPSREGLTRETKHGPVWTGEVRLNETWLMQPLKWKRPRRIFVVAHGDLFHESVPDNWIGQVMEIMNEARHHTYQVLTKRPDRMASYLASSSLNWGRALPHVQWGTSVEDQGTADERIPLLLDTPVAVRWVSAEPLLGPMGLERYLTPRVVGHPGLDWCVVGGESGPGARPMHPQWARDIRDQCVAAGVAFHFKQWGEHVWLRSRFDRVGKKRAGRMLDGREWNEKPEVGCGS